MRLILLIWNIDKCGEYNMELYKYKGFDIFGCMTSINTFRRTFKADNFKTNISFPIPILLYYSDNYVFYYKGGSFEVDSEGVNV